MPGEYIVAHDLGTSGNKAALVDLKGRVVAQSTHPYPTHFPKPDWAEQEPEDWWRAVCEGTRAIVARSGVSPRDIACLTFSAQLLGLVPMGPDGEAVRRPIIWLDARAADQARRLMRKFGGPRLFSMIAGASLSGKDGIPKLLWLKEREPETYRAMSCFVDVGGYMLSRCTGRVVMDWSGASAFALDLKRKTWMTGLLRFIGIDPAKLPPLVRSTDTVGPLTAKAAADLGLPEGTPVVAGAGDVPAAAVGAGAVGEGDGHVYIGTSGWISVVTSRRPRGKHGMAVIQSADPARNLILAEMETAGACVEWLSDQLYRTERERDRAEAFRAMNAAAEEVPAGSGRLVFTPWMYGERSPISDTNIRGAFLNLSIAHKREHLVRAAYEGVSYHFRWILEHLERDFHVRLPVLRVIGGGANSAPWMQILADVTRKRVETVPNPQEAGAVGAALTAAVGLGIYPSFESLASVVVPDRVYEPRDEDAAVYEMMFKVYKDTYRSVRRWYRRTNRAVPPA